jgi:hypothetical protein
MTRILFVGQKPETVDFSDPSLPPGFNAEKINAGIAVGVAKIEERGWRGDTCMITPDAAGNVMLELWRRPQPLATDRMPLDVPPLRASRVVVTGTWVEFPTGKTN